jgi:hypothetical protein
VAEGWATRQYYNRGRYYNMVVGRFLSEDPSGFFGGLNLYGYATNNPLIYVDTEGLAPRRPRHLPDGTEFRCKMTDSCKVLEGKIWTFNWLINGHIGFDLRPNYTGKPHTTEINDFSNGLKRCLQYYQRKCKKPECQKASEPNAEEVGAHAKATVALLAIGVAVALAPESAGTSLGVIPRLVPVLRGVVAGATAAAVP